MRPIEPAVPLLGGTFALALFITAVWSALTAPPMPVKAIQAPVQAPVEETNYPVLKKADQDRLPRSIPIERIVVAPEVTTEPAPVQTTEPEPARALKTRHKTHDICRGKGKRYYNHNRYWRCRR